MADTTKTAESHNLDDLMSRRENARFNVRTLSDYELKIIMRDNGFLGPMYNGDRSMAIFRTANNELNRRAALRGMSDDIIDKFCFADLRPEPIIVGSQRFGWEYSYTGKEMAGEYQRRKERRAEVGRSSFTTIPYSGYDTSPYTSPGLVRSAGLCVEKGDISKAAVTIKIIEARIQESEFSFTGSDMKKVIEVRQRFSEALGTYAGDLEEKLDRENYVAAAEVLRRIASAASYYECGPSRKVMELERKFYRRLDERFDDAYQQLSAGDGDINKAITFFKEVETYQLSLRLMERGRVQRLGSAIVRGYVRRCTEAVELCLKSGDYDSARKEIQRLGGCNEHLLGPEYQLINYDDGDARTPRVNLYIHEGLEGVKTHASEGRRDEALKELIRLGYCIRRDGGKLFPTTVNKIREVGEYLGVRQPRIERPTNFWQLAEEYLFMDVRKLWGKMFS